jgi:PEP-CTERM motif
LQSTSSPGTLLTFTITNQAALSAINAAITDGTFGLGGTVSGYTVPEPSTWVMMLAGFAGLGYLGRRRAAKRRAAAAG